MYNFHFGFSDAPFSIAPDPRYLYLSEQHREALAHLLYGIGDHGGFVVLTGEVGTGKTTVCRCLLQQLPQHIDVAFIVNPKLDSRELLQTICDELAVAVPESEPSIKQLIDALNAFLLSTHARGRNTILIIDEAQNLDPEVLEQLRLLTNLETNDRKLLQLILLGQPELNTMLAQPSLRQLAQRITARYHLRPLSRDEVTRYIEHRLAIAGCRGNLFADSAMACIYRYSQGIPRLINLLCDRALLGVYSLSGSMVDTAMVRRAAREVLPPKRSWTSNFTPTSLAVATALAIAVCASWFFYTPALRSLAGGSSAEHAAAADGWRDAVESAAADEPAALRQLYRLWNDRAPNTGIANCASWRDGTLRCLQLNALSIEDIRRYNRPVVLRLRDDDKTGGDGHFVVLKRLEQDRARIGVGDRDWEVRWTDLARQWRGDALLLVAVPVEQLPLQPGASGPLVAWLDERLYRYFHNNEPRWQRETSDHSDRLQDGAAKSAWLLSHHLALRQQEAGNTYDAPLLAQVKRFQQEHGLQENGVIDLATVLVISRLMDLEQPRLSDASVQRGS